MKTVKKQAYYLMYGLFKDFGKRPQKNQQLKKRRPAIDVAQLTEMLMKSAATRRRGTPPSTAKGIGAPPTSKGGAGTQFQSMVVVNVSTRPATTARQESELADNNDSEEEDDDLNLIKWSQSLPIEST
jgi:hypothetical protein